MFDPERDEDREGRRFYRRLLAVVLVSAAGCVALLPSVMGFSAGNDNDINCLAVKDGWHADLAAPSVASSLKADAVYPAPLTQEQLQDPAAVARFRAQWQVAQADPDVQRSYAYEDWVAGPGACVHQSRHRLILSGFGLGALGAVCSGVAIVRRLRGRGDGLPTEEPEHRVPSLV
jgi:hypothetical protein